MAITLYDHSPTSHTALLVLSGETTEARDGVLTVAHKDNAYPPLRYTVTNGLFNAIVHLQPGENPLVLTHSDGTLDGAFASVPLSSLSVNVAYEPLQTPPLHLVVVLFADSPGSFPLPSFKRHQSNDLQAAITRLKVMGRVLEACMGSAMKKMGFGYRTFHFEEDEAEDTLYEQKFCGRSVKTTSPKVHIIRIPALLADIRGDNKNEETKRLQQAISMALSFYGDPFTGNSSQGPQGHSVVLYMDQDVEVPLGANNENGFTRCFKRKNGYSLNMISSSVIHSWPSSLEQIVNATSDTQSTREMGLPQIWGRSSQAVLNASTRGLLSNMVTIFSQTPNWTSRGTSYQMVKDLLCGSVPFLSLLSFTSTAITDNFQLLYHPCFAHPSDLHSSKSSEFTVTQVSGHEAFVKSGSPCCFVDIHADIRSYGFIPFLPESLGGQGPQYEIVLKRDQLTRNFDGFCTVVSVFTLDQERHDYRLDDLFTGPLKGDFGLGRGEITISKSVYWGREDGTKQSIYFNLSKIIYVTVYSGTALDGLVFVMDDFTTVMIGKRGGRGSRFTLERNETISHFNVRSGRWMDAIQIVTSSGRRSTFFGGNGGGAHQLKAPEGFEICGLYGTQRRVLESLGIIYTQKNNLG